MAMTKSPFHSDIFKVRTWNGRTETQRNIHKLSIGFLSR